MAKLMRSRNSRTPSSCEQRRLQRLTNQVQGGLPRCSHAARRSPLEQDSKTCRRTMPAAFNLQRLWLSFCLKSAEHRRRSECGYCCVESLRNAVFCSAEGELSLDTQLLLYRPTLVTSWSVALPSCPRPLGSKVGTRQLSPVKRFCRVLFIADRPPIAQLDNPRQSK